MGSICSDREDINNMYYTEILNEHFSQMYSTNRSLCYHMDCGQMIFHLCLSCGKFPTEIKEFKESPYSRFKYHCSECGEKFICAIAKASLGPAFKSWRKTLSVVQRDIEFVTMISNCI